MGIQDSQKGNSIHRFKLPKVLSYYNKSDYTTQQKARFIYHLCIAAMVGMVFLIFSSTYVQLNNIEYNGISLSIIFSEISLLFFFGICLFLLTKGKYGISAHLFMTSAMACVWYVMWIYSENMITRLYIVVLIIALLNLMPLFITKYKSTILLYILANVLVLIVFVQIVKDRINLSDALAVNYIIDISVAMIFSGIVGYNIFRINKQSLEKVESDNQQRKKAEEALKQSELFRHTVFNSSTIPIVVMDSTSFKYIDINAAAVKMYGFPSHEASLGKTPIDVSAPVQYDGAPSSQKAPFYIKKALKEGSVTFEWLHQRPDGEFWDAEVHLLSFKSNDKTLLQFSLVNITERKKIESELRESELRYRTLFENAQIGIYQSTREGKFSQANPALIKMLGFDSFEELSKRNFNEENAYVDSSRKKVLELFEKKGFIKDFESKWKKKNNEIIIIKENSRVVRNHEGKILYYDGFVENITEKKIVEKELEKYRNHLEFLVKERTEELTNSNEELLSINEELHNQREELEAVLKNLQNTQKQLVQAEKMASLGVLASGVAHEINNPLNFIKGGIFGLEQYFNENLKEHKNEVSPLIEGINTGVERAANIVTSLNHYSRRDDSKLTECDIHTIIDNCLVILRNQIINRIDIKKNYSTQAYSLYGNEGKLHQVMLNILSNAIQAIDNKGIINIKTTVSKYKITIFVSDTGCGISVENMSKIFDPFFTTKEAGKGTGLGLSITFNILEEHKGTIEFESSVGNGTTAKIILPLSKKYI